MMKRSRAQPKRYQEELPRSSSAPNASQYYTKSPTKNMSISPRSVMDDPSLSFEDLPPHRYAFKLLSILAMLGIVLWSLGNQSNRFKMEGTASTNNTRQHHTSLETSNNTERGSIAIAHLGNSIQYFNDCPRMLEHMMKQKYSNVTQDSCLRGGANVTGLYEKGNGMRTKFATPTALQPDGTYDTGSPTVEALLSSSSPSPDISIWDFVIINDHTQEPCRPSNKTISIQTFQEKYIPLLERHNKNATVILLMTAAYKSPAKNSSDLGGFDNFTNLLVSGYAEYARLFLSHKVKIAPLGLAYQYIKQDNNNRTLQESSVNATTIQAPSQSSSAIVSWEALYAPDDFHPSPHGTYLEACLLYCTITGEEPPDYQVDWWSTARYMQPPTVQPPMPLPTIEEAHYLRRVASHLCNVGPADGANTSSSL